uniref:Uncharacterized protein n=1 Tax=Hyaloperonospora arabidopsidis (strain Emoy2) TaxID=559515 RepID=M4B831_HYAAE
MNDLDAQSGEPPPGAQPLSVGGERQMERLSAYTVTREWGRRGEGPTVATAALMARPDYSVCSKGDGVATIEAAAVASVPPDATTPDANPQPLTLEDLYICLIDNIEDAQSAELREEQVTEVQIFADINNTIPTKREQLAPHKARYPKLLPAKRALLTTFFEEACIKAYCSL